MPALRQLLADGEIDIAFSFVEGLFDVHHAGAGTLTQGLNVFDCVIRHYRYPIPWMFVAVWPAILNRNVVVD